MKLTTRARYALRLMLDVARHGEATAKPISLALVSERTGISRGYLEQLALALRNARLIRGISGRHGGYRLAHPADQISIGDIVEATIGPVCIVDCLEDPATCLRVEFCECRMVYALINYRITEVLRSFTIADLLNPDWTRAMRGELANLAILPSVGPTPAGVHPISEGRKRNAN
jgi:Rrf2 family protein